MRIEKNQDLYDALGSIHKEAAVQVVIGDRYIDVVQVNWGREERYDAGTVVLQLDESQFEFETHVTGLKFKD